MQKQGYRPDIDGLRAIAVLSVIIYHFNKEWLPGGFVGVDIFFVISGFLITGILYKSISEGSFTFIEFYARRIRRIVPASFVVTLTTMVVGSIYMLPADAQSLAESSLANALSLANVYFYLFLDTGYFAESSDMVPLLHMWSLGVEEQFYLLWPALLLAAYHLGGRRLIIVTSAGLAALSFWIGQRYLDSDPLFSYYMLPARAGELLMGALAFFIVSRKSFAVSNGSATALAFAGSAMVTASLVMINDDTGFPGFVSIVPALGTSLVIIAGTYSQNPISRIISIKPMIMVGLISFSMYLWHWPVLAFHRYAYGDPSQGMSLIWCAALIAILSISSYFLVEKPFRKKRQGRLIVRMAPYAVITVCLIGYSRYVDVKDGYIEQFSPRNFMARVEKLEESAKNASQFRYNCQTSQYGDRLLRNTRCVSNFGEDKPSVLLIGDSNGAHYLGYFREMARDAGISIQNVTHSSCPPLFDSGWTYTGANNDSCRAYNKAMKDTVLDYPTVIIGANWSAHDSPQYRADIADTISYLSENVDNVVIALKIPIFPQFDRECMTKSLKIPGMDCLGRSHRVGDEDHDINEYLRRMAVDYQNVMTASVREHICGDQGCFAYIDGDPLYFNSTHLSMRGSEKLGSLALQTGNIFADIEQLSRPVGSSEQ